MCPTKMLLKSFVKSNTPETKFFQYSLCSWYLWVLLPRSQLVRNHFFVSLPTRTQVDMVQPFGHLR